MPRPDLTDQPSEWLIEPRKISHYLLNETHQAGGPKARYFIRFGFSPADPNRLAFALLEHPTKGDLVRDETSSAGDRKLIFEGPIQSPDGRAPRVRTVWSVRPDGHARFVTAVPLTRG
ncbi:DUF6883 domain-containing protein [Methylobacterium sp. ap11]|uniref:DUF6883 domain-containing protein n=1 Tax=Methylobacterium sp. ap11 TaxID=1761799 RepID=UPI003299F606